MNAQDDIIRKIKKLLALSRSPNEHEAALALQKAQEMMAAHSVSTETLRMAEITEAKTKSSVKASPARWERRLFHLVSDAFGCQGIFWTGGWEKGEWGFIGVAPAPEIAAYAFQTLLRQAQAARRSYVAGLKRLKLATKRQRGNLFAEGWVQSVAGKITAFAGEDQTALIESYIGVHHPDLTALSKPRNQSRSIRPNDWGALRDGRNVGAHAQLNHGVGSGGETLALT